MSILAEPRRRQRLSVDPQNVQWKNDVQKISRKLMERMGWSDGDGLGRNCQGSSSNVKLKANYTGKGLGADKLASYDSTWIGHHDDFADLLNALNKNKEQKATTDEEKQERAKKISLELNSKSLRRRIHYQKFTRAKDISNFTENDRAAVLGIGLSKTKNIKEVKMEEPVEEKEEKSVELKSNTTVSTLSVAEYFAAKMAALKAKKEGPQSPTQEVGIKQGCSHFQVNCVRKKWRFSRSYCYYPTRISHGLRHFLNRNFSYTILCLRIIGYRSKRFLCSEMFVTRTVVISEMSSFWFVSMKINQIGC
ncbi:unnamed protein product [Haemonchus placei]|uniref:G-patch domain-containing protein n=1 Tax=Haemonchus placei TaxID=6290 RepID=A0A0N4W6U8_HAEPC|nr:unnamed protein product [Haemonchus placei]